MKTRLLTTCLVVVASLVAGVRPLAAQEPPLPEHSSRRAARGLALLVVCLLLLLTDAACVSAPPVSPSSPTAQATVGSATPSLFPTQTPAPQATVPPAATHTPPTGTPTSTPVPSHVIEPLVTAPGPGLGLPFDSWSPDSQWIAYWVGEAEGLGANLGFVNVRSGRKCQPKGVSAQDLGSAQVIWQEDDRVIAVVNEQGEALSGSVCGTFAPVENDAPPGRVTAVHVSPDGRYRAETRMLGSEVQATHETLTVTDLATGRTVATVPYARSIYTRWAARGWLNSELYLIGQTLDQGVLLYVSLPEGRTGNLFPEVFGLDADEESYVWLVDGHADPATGEYHLLLQQYKDSPGSPLWLYHSELDRVEEVPFHFAWPFFDSSSFTPDGRWLLLGNPIDEGEPFPVNYWLRPVDPPGAAAVEIARDVALDGFSGEARITAEIVAEAVLHHWAFCGLTDQEQEIAFCTRDYVRILSLADGGLLGQWRTSPSHVRYLRWSPDGKRAVAMGCDEQTQKEALFVIQMP